MMSNPPSSLPQQPRQLHRRQNSTPVIAFEAMKVSNNLPPTVQRQGVHRRGQSFDQHQRSPIRRQGNLVSMTNQGQHILREAQQLPNARPGQHHHSFQDLPVSQHSAMYHGPGPDTTYTQMSMSTAMPKSQSMQFPSSPYFPYGMSPAMSPMEGNFPNMGHADENSQHYFQNVHSSQDPSAALHTRRMSQPDLRLRPHTPADQIQTAQFPLTPPFTASVHHQPMSASRVQQDTPPLFSPNPVSMQRGRSLQGIVEHDESPRVQQLSPQRKAIRPAPSKTQSFDVAEMPVPGESSIASSPQHDASSNDPMGFFHDLPNDSVPAGSNILQSRPAPILTSTHNRTNSQSPSRPALSPRRMSISDLNLEPGIQASIEETNVSIDDIAQFIEGPDPIDNKWVCKYEDCDKRFGRKENIKSHVQTHLGDRQFRCDHCRKCFVRGHDLKRHAKIHTGTKPYPCLCGNSFARHDALTRHRQRGMCIGAFEGIVKKPIKRGRPRKHRPEMDDRMDKASRSRQAHDMGPYASSSSSGSPGSWDSPQSDDIDNLSPRDASPFGEVAFFGMPQDNLSLNTETASFPPEIFSFTPPHSPQYSTGNKPSPAHHSPATSHVVEYTQELNQYPQLLDESKLLPPNPSNLLISPNMQPASSRQGQTQSLPALSQASSSPPPEMVAFDFVDLPMTSAGLSTGMTQTDKIDERNEFDAFFDYGYGNSEMIDEDSFFALS